jgi:hypothetical protein
MGVGADCAAQSWHNPDVTAGSAPAPEIPDALMEVVVGRILTRQGAERETELARLAAAHPEHAAALRRLVAEHDATERLLAAGFAAPGHDAERTYGDYAIERELGRGGMGVVYLAMQRSLGRRVALKVLSAPLLADDRALARFVRESRLLAQLEHDGIVRVIDAGTAEGAPYYAMEYVDGAPLSAVVEAVRRHGLATATGATIAAAVTGAAPEPASRAGSERLSRASYVRAIADLGAQVADALAFAHAAGVIHRDVKPSNVLVRRDGSAVLTDFGIARFESAPSLTVTGGFAGTPYYVSPEQARGAQVDHRTDVYSLGVLLYEMLALARPFEAADTIALLGMIQRHDASDPRVHNSAIPAELAAVVLKALAKEPGRRYAGGGEMAADLRAFLDGRPVSARPPTRTQRLGRWCRREPWKAAALGTAVAAAGALAALSLAFTERLLTENASTRAALVLAEANFAKATEAVEEMLTRVGQRDLADVPQMEVVRRELLQRALAFYEDFARTRGADRGIRFQLALARGRVAWIRRQLNEDREAIASAQQAIAEFDALLGEAPGDASLRIERADAKLTLAAARRAVGEVETAQTELAEVIAALGELRVAPELEAARRRPLALALYAAADLQRFRDTALARTTMERAAAEAEWLFEANPLDAKVAAMLVNARVTLSRIAQNAGNTAAAESLLRAAGDVLERAPATTEIRVQRCGLFGHWSFLHKDAGELERAAGEAAAGVEAWQELVAEYPHMPFFRSRLVFGWTNLGNLRRYLEQDEEAIAATRAAIAEAERVVAGWPDVSEYRAGLGRALINLGSMLVRGRGGETARAEGRAALRRALEVGERLRAEDPDDAEHARLVADCLGETAFVELADGEFALAGELYERGAAVWGEAVARHPQDLGYQDGQANMLQGAAKTLLDAGDAAAALATVDRSLALLRPGLAKESRHPARRRFARNGLDTRARACALLGQHAAGTAALAELTELSDSASDSYAAAIVAADCMSGLPSPERDGYADAAMAALSQLVDRGHRDAGRLDREACFAPLRDDPRFKELQRRLSQ